MLLLFFKIINFHSFYNFSFFWNFGFIIFFIFIIQVFSGIILSFYINFDLKYILISKIFLLNNISYGWFFLKIHCIFPNFIFLLIYLHIFKSLISFMFYPLKLFISGIFLYLFFIIVVFTGYSIAGGSMGYWAIIVVFNILKYILGYEISSCIFFFDNIGVSSSTIFKLFSIHYLFSFFIFIFFFIHIFFLHDCGSSNNLQPGYYDGFKFSCFIFFKDIFLLFLFLFFIIFLTFLNPSIFFILGDNFVEIQEFKSVEIVVEWYLRFFFIVLRAINSKFFGIFFTFILFLFLFFYPLNKDFFRFNYLISTFILFLFLFFYNLILFSWYFFSSYLYTIPFFILLFFTIFNFIIFNFYKFYYKF
uniref:cytochrome b n=1 Tax=Myxobolus honghuensis TaxID=1085956 RepID=UPI003002E97A